jgi:GTPase SAR1 family protein
MRLDNPEQHGLGDPQMLAKIDKLFGCGVGELVNLPQIVVVGDQSSGKSSVLEGLIKKDLPRDSGLCTRFATQIVFRRALEEHISVSIIPDAASDAAHRATIQSWGRNDVSALDAETFTNIMREV